MSPSRKKILFMMSGSIAAFKACALLSKLAQAGHEVQVVASPAALQFVGAATLEGLSGRAVISDLFERGHAMDHINKVRWADLIVVVPATANFINRIAAGVGDDLLSTMFLAHDFKKPLLLAPAMNTMMYLHPATQASLKVLRGWGVKVLEAASGVLACGEQGYGRLLEPADLLAEIEKELAVVPATAEPVVVRNFVPSSAPRVLVTAGGTVEPLDGVRVLANESTGATGIRIAATLREAGLEVTLLRAERSGPAGAEGPDRVFRTFDDLAGLLQDELGRHRYDYVVQAAAVSDYRLAEVKLDGKPAPAGKLPSGHELTLSLKPNPKLIGELKAWSKNKDLRILGFKFTDGASETEKLAAAKKLFTSADWVLVNDTQGIDRAAGLHRFEILDRGQSVLERGERAADLAPAVLRLILNTSQKEQK